MGARSYEVSRAIDAPASTVWALLTDADSYGDWNEAVISIEGPIAEGSTVKLVSIADLTDSFELFAEGLKAAAEAQETA